MKLVFVPQVFEILSRKPERFVLSNTDIDKLAVKVKKKEINK
jgi:hypothetical protein